jgi:hypothetical protein
VDAWLRCERPARNLFKKQSNSGNVQGILTKKSVNVQATVRKHPGNIQGTFRQQSGNIHQETFRQRSGNIQATFREHSGNIQGAFGEHYPSTARHSPVLTSQTRAVPSLDPDTARIPLAARQVTPARCPSKTRNDCRAAIWQGCTNIAFEDCILEQRIMDKLKIGAVLNAFFVILFNYLLHVCICKLENIGC